VQLRAKGIKDFLIRETQQIEVN